jgi:nicotinamidase-related amidase
MRINRENTIGLVTDMQEKLISTINNYKTIIKNSVFLLQGLRLFRIPLIVTQQNTKGLGSTIPEINETIGNFSYIEKSSFSCYRESAFVRILNRIGKRNVVMIGVEAHVCILQTALDLLYNNFIPVVVEDCIGSAEENDMRVTLWRMRDAGIIITTSESLLFELCRDSGTNEFKELLKLVKEKKNA